jgi:hypothetical protein
MPDGWVQPNQIPLQQHRVKDCNYHYLYHDVSAHSLFNRNFKNWNLIEVYYYNRSSGIMTQWKLDQIKIYILDMTNNYWMWWTLSQLDNLIILHQHPITLRSMEFFNCHVWLAYIDNHSTHVHGLSSYLPINKCMPITNGR